VTGPVSRRDLLRAGAAGAALASLPGCDGALRFLGSAADPLPGAFALADGAAIDPDFHLLSRATYGARPGDLDEVRRTGRKAWLERQLHPDSVPNPGMRWRLLDCEMAFEMPDELTSVVPREVERHVNRATLLRAVHDRRQLLEVMTGFWRDHFSIDVGKRGCLVRKPLDDENVLRRHALGRFRDLVRASAVSPAMLVYLDGRENRLRRPGDKPNENYARELLELHTLGVHGGYTQQDVMEAARCLTGWTVDDGAWRVFARKEGVFRKEWHDDGEKVVLGRRIPAGGGAQDLDRLVDVLCAHPSTARHLAWKLCRRFVRDDPPASLVDSAAALWERTYGDVRAVVRHVLRSTEFEASAGRKVKRPFRFVVSALRALGVESRAGGRELDFLARMGHLPHHYPTPDGYPEEPEPWMGTLLWRWNFALALATRRLGPTRAELRKVARGAGLDPATASPAELAPLLVGRRATDGERELVDAFADAQNGGDRATRLRESVALLLCSPAFQVH
jgi:uncharacterized protein (DUF1800 family)